MSKVKEILRLKFDVGLSLRDIAASCNCGKSTVDDVLKRAQNAKISWPCESNSCPFYTPAEARKTGAEPDLNYIFSAPRKFVFYFSTVFEWHTELTNLFDRFG